MALARARAPYRVRMRTLDVHAARSQSIVSFGKTAGPSRPTTWKVGSLSSVQPWFRSL